MHFKSLNVTLVHIYFFFKFPNTSTPTRVGVFHVLERTLRDLLILYFAFKNVQSLFTNLMPSYFLNNKYLYKTKDYKKISNFAVLHFDIVTARNYICMDEHFNANHPLHKFISSKLQVNTLIMIVSRYLAFTT